MDKFAIITDSCVDLDKDLRDRYDIDYVSMRYLYDDKDVPASLDWEHLSYHDFYDLMRKGTRIKMAQVPSEEYFKKFSYYLEKGMDVLSLSCSSALSASYFAGEKVAEELRKRYPERKIYCVDSLSACMGLGIINLWASTLRAGGKKIDEDYAEIEAHKLEVNQFATVADLNYLKRAGRVKAAAAFFGGIMQVKPIIISDAAGQNFAIEKVKGRKQSISRIIELFCQSYDRNAPFGEVFVSHADEPDTAEEMRAVLSEKLGADVKISVGVIGPIVGASVGPGTVAVYGFGKKVTING
ncbi:MAG: DegV family protein [Clostridia bacterium]|nr:DegV family protein [Clostridia bacterium]